MQEFLTACGICLDRSSCNIKQAQITTLADDNSKWQHSETRCCCCPSLVHEPSADGDPRA